MKISLLPSFVAEVSDRRRPLCSLNVLAVLVALVPLSALAQGNDNPTGVSGIFNGNSNTGCSYDPYTANATRTIPDITVTGAVGSYPLQWSRTMNSRGGGGFFGAGGGWRHSYQWSCLISGDATGTPDNYTVYYPDGRKVIFGDRIGLSYKGPSGVTDRFTGAFATGDCYLVMADGGKVKFHQTGIPDEGGGYNFTMDPPDEIIDPNGLHTLLDYDASNKLTQVTEPAGRWIKISYNTSGTYVGLISEVDAGYGTATYTQIVTYDYQHLLFGTGYWNVLWHANYSDAAGSTATYTYQTANDSSSGAPLIKTCSDLRYPGPMKNIAYTFVTAGFHGQFLNAKHLTTDSTPVVSYNYSTHTETRGDGPMRAFTYGANLGTTGVYKPYLLKTYTDFAGHTATLSYDANGYVSSLKDFNLNTTSFTRIAATGAITKITHPGDASHIDYVYEDPTYGYYLKSVTDELLNVTTYKHSNTTTMNTSEIDYPDGGVELFSYNGFNQVTSHTMVSNAGGNTTTGGVENFTYDGRGLLTKYTPPTGTNGATQYSYNVNDHLSTITDPLDNVTTLYHDQVGRLTIIQYPGTAPSDVDVGFVYNLDGTLQYQSVKLNATAYAETDYTYDDYKRLLTVKNPIGNITNFWYDKSGNAASDFTHTDSNVTRLRLPSLKVMQTIYDENLRKDTVKVGFGTTEEATTNYDYDAVGNVTKVTDPMLNAWNYFYDERNRLTGVDDPIPGDRNSNSPPHSVSYTYDVASNRKSAKPANDQTINYDYYDSMNRLTQMTVGQLPSPAAVTHYAWTKAGKLASMTDPGGSIYSYTYDTLNRLVTTTYPSGGGTETRTYDSRGNLFTFKNRANATQTFGYDARNRETSDSWSNGNPQPRTLTYDNASRMTSCNATNTSISYVYYDDDTLKSETTSGTGSYGDGTSRTITYGYDVDGNRSSVTWPGLSAYSYQYTKRNQLQSFTASGANVVSYVYDLSGNPTSRTSGTNPASSFVYDAMNRATKITHNFAGPTSKTIDYGYDEVSRRRYAQRDGNGMSGTADGFDFDKNGQLTAFHLNGTLTSGVVGGGTVTSYTLDESGNRTNAGGVNYVPNNLNQYTSVGGVNVSNGNNGNISGYDGWTYSYDSMKRLTSADKGATTSDFYYDGLGREVARVENGLTTYSLYDGWNLFAEYDASGAQTNRWIYAGGDLIRRYNAAQGTLYFYPDAQGSTTHLADSSGNLVEKYTYGPYGMPTVTTISGGPYNVEELFTGQKWYSQLGLYDLRHRAYMPSFGRFLQPDPIGFAGDPNNLYRYCGNNPANWSDPSGLGNKLDGSQSDGTQKYTPLGSHIPLGYGANIYSAFNLPSGYSSTNGWGSRSGSPSAGGNNSDSLTMGWINPDGSYSATPPPDVEIERIIVPGEQVNAGLSLIVRDIVNWAIGVSHAARMFSDWAGGTGPEIRVFGRNSLESRNMATDPQLPAALRTAAATGRPQTVPFGSAGLRAAGLNPTRQFVGSYSVESLSSSPSIGLIYNRTGLWSAALHIPGVPSYTRSIFPPFGNTYQFYVVEIGGGP